MPIVPQAAAKVGAYKPIAAFLKGARRIRMKPTFVNISFVGSGALAKELGRDGEGVVITQVVPLPWDSSIPLVQQYQAAMKAQDAKAEPHFVSLGGYIVGRIAIAATGKVQGDITRDAFLKVIAATGSFDLGGVTLTYGAGDNQGLDEVFLTIIQPDGDRKSTRLNSSH